MQVRQLHAQVHMHAQLLLQTMVIAGQRQPGPLVAKRWAWDEGAAAREGPFRVAQVCLLTAMLCSTAGNVQDSRFLPLNAFPRQQVIRRSRTLLQTIHAVPPLDIVTGMQDAVASEACAMLFHWRALAADLAAERAAAGGPVPLLSAPMLEAVSISGAAPSPEAVVDSLRQGWRPVILGEVAPSIADVPWLHSLDTVLDKMGFVVQAATDDTPLAVRMVRLLRLTIHGWTHAKREAMHA